MSETDDSKRKVGWVLRELDALYSPVTLEIRAENAYGVANKLFDLIRQMIPNEDDQKRMMKYWLKSVVEADFRKFIKVLKRYDRAKDQGIDL
jgi:hypothetical protein